jgi:hypothetical protein
VNSAVGSLWIRNPSLRVPEKTLHVFLTIRERVTNSHERHPDAIYHLDLKPRQHIHGCQNPLVGDDSDTAKHSDCNYILAGAFNSAANHLTQIVFRSQSARRLFLSAPMRMRCSGRCSQSFALNKFALNTNVLAAKSANYVLGVCKDPTVQGQVRKTRLLQIADSPRNHQ